MTTREFMMHLVMNCEPDDPVTIEVKVDGKYVLAVPVHACKIGEDYDPETLIECKSIKEDK